MKYIINNLEELNRFASILAKFVCEGDVFSLKGDLGAGKTTLVQMVGKELGIDDYITSPTFALVNIYQGDFTLYHLDLYRLNTPEELESLDFETYFYPDGVTFIEWAEMAGDYLPEELVEISMVQDGEARLIEISTDNQRGLELERFMYENFSNWHFYYDFKCRGTRRCLFFRWI